MAPLSVASVPTAGVPAVRHWPAPVVPSGDALPACARCRARYRRRTRIPCVSARIAPPLLSSPSRASCFFSRRLRVCEVGHFTASKWAALVSKSEVHPNQITEWKRQLLEHAAEVFGTAQGPAPVDLAPLHAKIGQQALELDFLARALSKAGGLGAKL